MLAIIFVIIASSSSAIAIVSTDAGFSSGGLTPSETLQPPTQLSTGTNTTSATSTQGNSTITSYLESDELEALSKISHPKIYSTPNESSNLTPLYQISTPITANDPIVLPNSLNETETVAPPTPMPKDQTDDSTPVTQVSLPPSPQPVYAPINSSKAFLTESLCGVAIVIAISIIVVALCVKRRKA